MTDSIRQPFVVLYRWKVTPGKEQQLIDTWSRGTIALRKLGSFGSRLHKGPDDIWYAYAQWPSAEARDKAFALREDLPESEKIGNLIDEWLPEIILEPVADFLVLPK